MSKSKLKSKLSPLLRAKLEAFPLLQPNSTAHKTLSILGILTPDSTSSIRLLASNFINIISQSLHPHPQSSGTQFSILTSDLINSTRSLPPFQSQQELDRILLSNFIPWAAQQTRPGVPQGLTGPTDPRLHAGFASLAKLTDIRRPQDLYPDARRYKRQIHLHVGPTNSGKTHAGLRALHSAHTGVYAGPLRLLAHEVFSRMNAGQIAPDLGPRPCNLLTGEEQRIVSPTAGLTSCTVEMLSSTQFYDVVVIDEIQMIADPHRGDAWTQALLGVQAKEVHLCGEESVVGLVEQIARSSGDQFLLHRYQRLTPLKVSANSLGNDLSNIRPGDCVVAFSRSSLYALKKRIQDSTNLRVGMAYGGLPPEVREREAQLFNLGSQFIGQDGYDVLVGSDAIGMGLNLKIKRVIFESLHKFDGRNEVPLSVSQIKQIGGRAGRYGTKAERRAISVDGGDEMAQQTTTTTSDEEGMVGEVLTLQESDMGRLRQAMGAPFVALGRAVLKAPYGTVEGLARRAPERVWYASLLELRGQLSLTSPEYAIGEEKNAAQLADALEPIRNLSRAERDLFSSAPANPRAPLVLAALQAWARAHAARAQIDLDAWARHSNLPQTLAAIDALQAAPQSHSSHLHESMLHLESIHKALVLYLWLAFRLPESFVHSHACNVLKLRVEAALGIGLNSV